MNIFDLLADYIVRFRRPILVATAAFTLACLALTPGLDFNFTPQQLFESRSGAHEYRKRFAERFGREDNVITLLIHGEDLLQPESLGPIRDLTYELRQLDHVTDAQSVATMTVPRQDSLQARPHLEDPIAAAGEGGIPRPVRGPPVSAQDAQTLADFALSEPLIVDRLISHDRTAGIIAVWIAPEIQEVPDIERTIKAVEQAIEHYTFPDDISLEVRGIPPLRIEIVNSLWEEQLFFVPVIALIFLIILIIIFRRPSGIVLPLLTVLITLVATLALIVVTDTNINIINHVLPVLIVVIGISDSIHMLNRQTEEVEGGLSHLEATKAMIRSTGAACLFTSVTTAVGFLSLLTADTKILQNFGWQAATGVIFAYVVTLFFLPAALVYMRPAGRGRSRQDDSGEPPRLERSLVYLGEAILDRPWTVLIVSLLLGLSISAFAARVVVDTRILELFGDDHPTAIATWTIEEKLGGILPMEISFESEERDRFKDPELYAKIHELQRFAADQPQVLSTESYIDYLQAARVALLGDMDQRQVMPESQDQIEQLLLLISEGPDSRSGIAKFVTGDFRNTRLLLRLEDAGARASLALADELEGRVEELFGGDDSIQVRITGDAYVASSALSSFVLDLWHSLLLALVIIFGLMIYVFRSFKIGLLAIIPNCLPLLITLGYMGLAGIPLNTATIIIFAISLGIAVDDTIHFIARFNEERHRQPDLRTAIIQTYFGTGRAIILTSVLLLIGLSLLNFSHFVPTQQFGLLTGITILSALLADLIILPPLLYLAFSGGSKD